MCSEVSFHLHFPRTIFLHSTLWVTWVTLACKFPPSVHPQIAFPCVCIFCKLAVLSRDLSRLRPNAFGQNVGSIFFFIKNHMITGCLALYDVSTLDIQSWIYQLIRSAKWQRSNSIAQFLLSGWNIFITRHDPSSISWWPIDAVHIEN